MKTTTTTTHIVATITALAIGLLSSAGVKADSTTGANTLIYTNQAYIYSIHDAPNPVAEKAVQNAEIIYVSLAYGPAIYSYPSNVAPQHTAFNVEYVDTAYGPALYSYPNHHVKHRLSLVENAKNLDDRFIVPVSSTGMNSAVRETEIFH